MNNDCRAFKPNHVSNPFEYDQLQLIGIQTVKKLAITDETKLEHNYNPGLDESERQRLNPSNALSNAQHWLLNESIHFSHLCL